VDPQKSSKFRKAVVTKVKRCAGEARHGSLFKYTLRFDDDGSELRTRLLHLPWKPAGAVAADRKRSAPSGAAEDAPPTKKAKKKGKKGSTTTTPRLPSHQRILAPMVGGSELAFRLLCRRYGADLAYTPMINSQRCVPRFIFVFRSLSPPAPHPTTHTHTSFAVDPAYRDVEFQTTPEDRPLVAHFSANDPHELLAAALLVQDQCDAIDLVLHVPFLSFCLPLTSLRPCCCAPGRIWGVRSVWRMPGTLAATCWATRTAPSSSTSYAPSPKVRT